MNNNLSNRFAALSLDSGDPQEEEVPACTSAASENGRKMRKKEKRKASVSKSNRVEVKNFENQSEQPVPCNSLNMPLVWIDLEMTGLNFEEDRILEIACIISDGQLVKTIEGPDLIINQSEECLARMGEWCQNQHSASGLVEAVRKSSVTEQEAEQQKYMPNLATRFSHVVVDVSSIKALCFRWYPKDAKKAPAKKNTHRALDDIKESIAELRYMQKTIFKASQRNIW